MLVFGFPWSLMNLVVCGLVFIAVLVCTRKGECKLMGRTLAMVVVLPVWVFMTIMPFGGSWIVLPLVQNVRCSPSVALLSLAV